MGSYTFYKTKEDIGIRILRKEIYGILVVGRGAAIWKYDRRMNACTNAG